MTDERSGYEYEVFVSYRAGFADADRKISLPTRTWTREVFAPELRRWLAADVGQNRVFVDRDEITPGARWPEDLARKLARSKVLVAILDASYRESTWCMAELETMVKRERLLGVGPSGDDALIVPVRFGDGRRFPEAIAGRQLDDFHKYAPLETVHKASSDYLEMRSKLRELCERLRSRLESPPDWSPDWPVVRPPSSKDPSPAPSFALPEL